MIFGAERNKELKKQVEEIIGKLHKLTIEIKHESLAEIVEDLKERIQEPFMFVIVGEVKAGKSSFINALLDVGQEICKVAPSPMTDTIQQILYGEEEKTVEVNPYLKKIFLPVDILKEVAIVDTPGTNTIVDHHQEITERFIPASDLIIFVFESKNPYRQSAWNFLEFIQSDWRKKIIFILQQKDLMEEDDLAINMKGVVDHATQKGIESPQVFAVSAKQELNGDKENSGYLDLRKYIADNITNGQAERLKIQNNISTGLTINDKIFKGLILRKEQLESDVRFRDDILETLDRQEDKTKRQIDILTENLVSSYNHTCSRYEEELREGLSFFSMVGRSFRSMFSKNQSPKEWLVGLTNQLDKDLNHSLKEKLQLGVRDIAENIQQMGKMVQLKIRNSETILENDHEIFSDIAERRAYVLEDLQRAFSEFMSTSENFYDESMVTDSQNMAPNLAAGGGIAIVGVILATVTNGMVFDITGGILTTVGLLFAGVTIGLKKRKIMTGFRVEITKGMVKLKQEVNEKLKSYTEGIKHKIDSNFRNFDKHLDSESNKVSELEGQIKSIDTDLERINKELV